MNKEEAFEHDQQQLTQAVIAVTAGAFSRTSWERPLQRDSVDYPERVMDVYRGMVGLYWAYAGDMPAMQHLHQPTRELLTEITQQQARLHVGPETDIAGRDSTIEIVTRLQAFVGMWVSEQPRSVSTRVLAQRLRADAAERLDTRTYESAQYDQALLVIANDYASKGRPDIRQRAYKTLTRHFSDSDAVPPTTIMSEDLQRVLGMMRHRYARIGELPGYIPDADGAQLLSVLLGDGSSNPPLSLKEVLSGVDNPDERGRLRAALALELKALTDTSLLEWLSERTQVLHVGALAIESATTQDNPLETFEVGVKDADLWALVDTVKRSGEEGMEAFGKFYEQTEYYIMSYLYSLVRHKQTAEDLKSQVYLKAIVSLPRLKNQGTSVKAWLFTVAQNLANDHFKRAYVRLERGLESFVVPIDMSEDQMGHAPDSPYLGPESALAYDWLQIDATAAIERLTSEEQKECLRLRFIEDLSVTETAQRMGKSEGAVKAIQYRAMQNLRNKLPRRREDF